jgi:hypothetical protein
MNVEIERQNIIILFGNNEAVQFHFWDYINLNQTFILDSHLPFICRASGTLDDKSKAGFSNGTTRRPV